MSVASDDQIALKPSDRQAGESLWAWLYELRPPPPALLNGNASDNRQQHLLHLLLVPTAEAEFLPLCRTLRAAGEYEAACAAAIGGFRDIFESGRDFSAFTPWLDEAGNILAAGANISHCGRGALLLNCAIAHLLGSGDLHQAGEYLGRMGQEAEAANSDALHMIHASALAYREIMAGRLLVAHALISDALHLPAEAEPNLVPTLHLQATLALLNTLRGRNEDSRECLDDIIQHPLFDALPNSLWLLAMSHRLLTLATGQSSSAEIEACAERIRALSIPKHNDYHRSYMHYALGAASLLAAQPETALFHARNAIGHGRSCHSAVAQRTSQLLEIQALHDLGRDPEALALIDALSAGWGAAGAFLLVASAAIEKASLMLRQGNIDLARLAVEQARSAMPPGEEPPRNLRREDFVANLLRRLEGNHPVRTTAGDTRPVQILTFGELCVAINGRIIHDRDWHGSRGKTLLKALIVLGGYKVPAERLCDLLWPDADGDVARNNLKVALWRLRRLGCPKGEKPLPWVAVRHGHVSLVTSLCRVDCIAFTETLKAAHAARDAKRLRQALALVEAEFLGSCENESWINQHRESLKQAYLRATFAVAEAALQEQAGIDPLPVIETALRMAPDDARLQRLLTRFQSNSM